MRIGSTLLVAVANRRVKNLPRGRPAALPILLATSACLLLGACGDDGQAPQATATSAPQQPAATPALTIATPAPPGATATSQSLVPPVIHTVD